MKKSKFLIVLLFIIFLLRLPSLFEPYWYGDEGIYLTVGMAIRKGLLLYRDIFDNKPPFIYLLTAIANGSLFWFRFFLLSSTLASIYFFYRLSDKILREKKAVKLACLVFSFLTTARLFEGNIANAENFILLPTLAGLFWLWSSSSKNKFKVFLTGIILGLGVLFKATALFDFAPIFLFFLFFGHWKKTFYLLPGYFAPLLLVSLFFLTKGVFGLFFKVCFIQMIGYLSSWQSGSHAFSPISLLKTDLFLKSVVLLLISFFFWIKRKNLPENLIFAVLWFIFALFSATISGRPYAHYLIQTVPPLALVVGFLLTPTAKKIILPTVVLIFVLLGVAFFRYRYWVYPTFSYYANFGQFITGVKNKNRYFAYFNPQTLLNYEMAESIQALTKPENKIFIWADEPSLYPLARRIPAAPYTSAYHVLDLKKQTETLFVLQKEKPVLILVDKNKNFFSGLNTFLERSYLKIKNQSSFTTYLRRHDQ